MFKDNEFCKNGKSKLDKEESFPFLVMVGKYN